MEPNTLSLRIDQLPLWRLLVALDDAERAAGSGSPTARTLAREIRRRLEAGEPVEHSVTVAPRQGVAGG